MKRYKAIIHRVEPIVVWFSLLVLNALPQEYRHAQAATNSDDYEPERLFNLISVSPFGNNLNETVQKKQQTDNGQYLHNLVPLLFKVVFSEFLLLALPWWCRDILEYVARITVWTPHKSDLAFVLNESRLPRFNSVDMLTESCTRFQYFFLALRIDAVHFNNLQTKGSTMEHEFIAFCGIDGCECPLEAEIGHWEDGHGHDGKTGPHAHCPVHGAIYFD